MTKEEFLEVYSEAIGSASSEYIKNLHDENFDWEDCYGDYVDETILDENHFLEDLIDSLAQTPRTINFESNPIYIEAAKLLYEIYRDCED